MPQLLSPAQLIENLFAGAPPQLRRDVLSLAQKFNQQRLQQLEDQHLAQVETGWADDWQLRHNRTTETLAEIERALATC